MIKLSSRVYPQATLFIVIAILFAVLGYSVGILNIKPVEKTVIQTLYIPSTSTIEKTITLEITRFITVTYRTTYTTTYTVTETTTLTQPLTLLTTETTIERQETQIYAEPYLRLGDRLAIVMPFIYFDKVIYYRDTVESMDRNWVVNASFDVNEEGLVLKPFNMCALAYNNVVKVDRYKAYKLELSVPKLEGVVYISIASISPQGFNKFLSVQLGKLLKVYSSGKLVSNQNFIELVDVKTLEMLFAYAETSVEVFVKRQGIDTDWVLLTQLSTPALWVYGARVAVEVCNSEVIIKNFTVYQLAPTGIRDLRPIFDWSNGKYNPRSILRDSEGNMMFFATGGFYKQALGILILKSKDFVNFEPIKLLIVKNSPWYTGQGFLFKWVDGRIHGYIMNWGGEYQGGLHRLVRLVLDQEFNVVEVNENITLVNAPPGGRWGHYDITVFKFKGTWYAITSSFSAGTILWRLEDGPTSTKFTYVKTIFEKGHENPSIYPVISSTGEVQLMLSVATDTDYGACHKIYILDTDFNPVKEYKLISYRVWSAGHTYFLDPWYIYVNQDQLSSRVLPNAGIWPGAFVEIYKLETNYRYYIEDP